MLRVVFLGGLGRSGTTLLERMIGELDGVAPLGEVVHLWRRGVVDDERCACGARFSGCTFWRRVGERAFDGWERVDLARVRHLRARVERSRHLPRLALPANPGYRALIREYADGYARIYRAAAEVARAHTVVDSSKHSALAYCLRQAGDIDLRVVHMVRDSRGVAYSWTKTVARPESDGDVMTRYRPGRAAMLWNAHNVAFGVLGRRGVPVLRVRYEQLLADPPATLRSVAAFAGLAPPDLGFLGTDSVRLGVCHSVAGNPMRFAIGDVPLRRDEEWRLGLPAGQRRLVGTLTAPLLAAYGYGRR